MKMMMTTTWPCWSMLVRARHPPTVRAPPSVPSYRKGSRLTLRICLLSIALLRNRRCINTTWLYPTSHPFPKHLITAARCEA